MSGVTPQLCRSCHFEKAEIYFRHMDTRPAEMAFTASPPQHSYFRQGIQGLQQSLPKLSIITAPVLCHKPPLNP